ncbi:MAG TPA: FAD-binding oxidoreductase, partial [Thermoanaerobaculia bacterium]|nr:FAD-binding oxidoreductase [Thermoanaerobaculia bacterium]
DVHSQLNPTRVAEVVPVASAADLRALVRRAAAAGLPLAVAGGRHAMGGQQFARGALLADTRRLARVLRFDRERGQIEVEAGIQWPELIAAYERLQRGDPRPWGIAQKQTGADKMSVGGALASNVHGRGLTLAPFVQDVESFTLVDAGGELRTCSRRQEPELFRLAAGGYGLFGPVYSVTLRLVPRRKLERVVEVIDRDALADAFARRIAGGFLYGDFQFSVDPRSPDFLRRGVFSCYRPAPPDAREPKRQRRLSNRAWIELLRMVHEEPSRAFDLYARYYLSTNGQLYWSDTQQLGFYPEGYHRRLDRRLGAAVPATEIISEVYVPRRDLAPFLAEVAEDLHASGTQLIYGTVRLIERDAETFLPWAKQPYACIVVNYHAPHSREGLAAVAASFRRLIDRATARGGSYYLTYHRYADRRQVETCYPQLPAFLRAKLEHDPEERFQSDWYRHYRRLFADVLAV